MVTQIQALQDELQACAITADAIDVSLWDCRTREEIANGLAPQVVKCANESLALLTKIVESIDGSKREGAAAATDTALMAHWELGYKFTSLTDLKPTSQAIALIECCCRVRRTMLKCLSEVERALCRTWGMSSRLIELKTDRRTIAITTRRAYRGFILSTRRVQSRLAAGEIRISEALRFSAANLAKLLGHDIFDHMRAMDRGHVRTLQTQVFTWVRNGQANEIGARRLWLDIAASTELLNGIQQRGELLEYDHELLGEALELLDSNSGDDCVEKLSDLRGRDPVIDKLIVDGVKCGEDWRAAILRLHTELGARLGLTSKSLEMDVPAVPIEISERA